MSTQTPTATQNEQMHEIISVQTLSQPTQLEPLDQSLFSPILQQQNELTRCDLINLSENPLTLTTYKAELLHGRSRVAPYLPLLESVLDLAETLLPNTAGYLAKLVLSEHQGTRDDDYTQWEAYRCNGMVVSNHSQTQVLTHNGPSLDHDIVELRDQPKAIDSISAEGSLSLNELQTLQDDELSNRGFAITQAAERTPLIFSSKATIVSRENPNPTSKVRILLALVNIEH